MQEDSRYAVGIDVGTSKVRCVVAHIDPATNMPSVVGVSEVANNGMRKGTIVNLAGPAEAIDKALGEAERMSGFEVNAATLSINGSHIVSTKADGMIAVGATDHTVGHEDIMRIEEVATIGKVPANRVVLEVVPHSYRLDAQSGIKDPVGMNGTRLEINANVVSALAPNVSNLRKVAEMANVRPNALVPSPIAAGRAVLNERQIESGVAIVDMGAATTSVCVYEEGDLQYVGVVPTGSNHITNDLAIGLQVDPEIADKVKLDAATADNQSGGMPQIEYEGRTYSFSQETINEIVEARLDELFEAVNKELEHSGYAGKLPSGVVLVGAGANMQGMAEYAKTQLKLAVKIGKPSGFGGLTDQLDGPEWATAVGLMLSDIEEASQMPHNNKKKSHHKSGSGGGIKGFLAKFKF